MKKNSQALVVVVVIVIVLVMVIVGYMALQKGRQIEPVGGNPEVFHSEGFALDIRFFQNQLVVLNRDNTLNFYDIASGQMTPYTFPSELFDTIHHFSFAPSKKRAFVIGSKQTGDTPEVRYAIIDLERYVLVWVSENVLSGVTMPGYRLSDVVPDAAGEEFLFSVQQIAGSDMSPLSQLIVVSPFTKSVKPLRTIPGDSSIKYYNSLDQRIIYNTEENGRERGVLLIGGSDEKFIPTVESISIFPNDIVFGSYSSGNALVFSSINAPENVRLTVKPDLTYPLLSPSVVRSTTGIYTAYHVWKPGTREGIVRVVGSDQIVMLEHPVQGSVEMFFSPDEKKILLVTERSTVDGLLERKSSLIDLTTSESSSVALPESISSVIGWN